VTDLAHLYPDNPDARVLTWAMVTAFRNLVTQPQVLMHGDAFYPVGLSLTFSEPLFVPALVAGPVHAMTGNPVLAYNVTLILFWALSGWAMYVVAIRVTRDRAAALMAAVIFTVCPYRTDMYIEFNMEMTFGIPLAIYALVRFLEGNPYRFWPNPGNPGRRARRTASSARDGSRARNRGAGARCSEARCLERG
jgi:hypothetical protein